MLLNAKRPLFFINMMIKQNKKKQKNHINTMMILRNSMKIIKNKNNKYKMKK